MRWRAWSDAVASNLLVEVECACSAGFRSREYLLARNKNWIFFQPPQRHCSWAGGKCRGYRKLKYVLLKAKLLCTFHNLCLRVCMCVFAVFTCGKLDLQKIKGEPQCERFFHSNTIPRLPRNSFAAHRAFPLNNKCDSSNDWLLVCDSRRKSSNGDRSTKGYGFQTNGMSRQLHTMNIISSGSPTLVKSKNL